MSANAVLDGNLAELKFIKTRSVCQMIVEIPIERAEDAIAKFGIPLPGQEIPVALARLVIGQSEPEPAKPVDSSRAERAKEAYALKDDMAKAVTRASLLCKDENFRRWFERNLNFVPGRIADAMTCVDFLRRNLRIGSRSEIGTDERAFREFLALETSYKEAIGLLPERRF